jgi:exopolysaccharide production protein ExoQ
VLLDLPNTAVAVQSSTTMVPLASKAGNSVVTQTGIAIWSLCFLSFLGLELIQAFGTLATILFLAPWVIIIAPRPNQFSLAVIWNWPLLVFPGFAILSVLWSRDPAWSLRNSIEYLVTILIGIAAANCVNRRTLINALMIALTFVNTAGALYALYSGRLNISGLEDASHGISGLFGSKNQLAGAACVQILLALSFLFFDRNTAFQKIIFISIAILGFFDFYIGRSGGAFVSLLAALSMTGLIYLSNKSRFLALSLIVLGLLCAGAVLAEIDLADLSSRVLSGLGKDKTLTGRTDLWKVALDQIDDKPFTGDGYGAFWRPGNPKAEVLWAEFGINNKVGFHFHDTYLQIGVDLGLFGFIIVFLTVARALLFAIKHCLRSAKSQEIAIMSVLAFYAFWSLVEVEFISPFFISVLVICLCKSSERPLLAQS